MNFLNWLAPVLRQSGAISPHHQILNDPYYRLRSLQEIAIAAHLGVKIDANQASVDDWLRLPGLSIHQARSLVELTQAGVRFYCIEDVAAALGLPPANLKYLEPVLTFYYYDTDSIYTPEKINPNLATVEMLSQIPAIDLMLAEAIVNNRTQIGAYRNLADFQRRLSLPGDAIGKLMHYLRF
jgi:DNA uptake protein ComE-like DNA-binding protein